MQNTQLLELHPVTEDKQQDYLRCVADVYGQGKMPGPNEGPDFENSNLRFVTYERGEPAASYTAIPYPFTRGPALIQGAGIASVAVRPQFRGGGLGSALMRESLHQMRRDGLHLAALYAFRDKFYRRFGYEVAGYRWKIQCPMDRLPAYSQELEAICITDAELGKLQACHEAFSHSVSGAVIRNAERWKNRMGKNTPMIYALGDPVEAFCWTRMEGGFWEELSIGELAWSTRRGYESAMAFIRTLAINQSGVMWMEPSSGPYLTRGLDQGMSVSLYRQAMYRVLNLSEAISKLKPVGSGEFTIRIQDEELPENQGPWKIAFEGNHVKVTASDTADLAMNIGHFTQAFLGEPDLVRLRAHGLVDVYAESSFEAACRLLPPSPTYLTEFF